MTVELFGESSTEVPALFKKFISKIKTEEDVKSYEFLYLAILYNLYEMGFVPCHSKFKNHIRISFDQADVQNILSLPSNEIYSNEASNNTMIAKLRLGPEGNPEATLIGHPSNSSKSEYLTVHFFVKKPRCLTSHCFDTASFVNICPKDKQIKTQRLDKLARAIKDYIGLPIKQPLLLYSFDQCVPHLLGLPEHVFKRIKSYLPPNTRRRLEDAISKRS